MGYDCTLHAVDGEQITSIFVDAVLAGKVPEKGSLADVGIESETWESVFTSLRDDAPATAASMVCQLALVFAAKKWPYHYERGFAVCLWPEQEEPWTAEFPNEFCESPEVMFRPLVKKYPQLKGAFPQTFSGNWSTGTFIPANKVSKALRWVKKTVEALDEGDQGLFRGLLLVLDHCVKYKLAYWEGTDLPVPMAEMSLEGNEARRAARSFKWPDYGYLPLAQKKDLFVCKYSLGPNDSTRTALADFSVWPPKLEWLHEYAIGAALSDAGKLVTRASHPKLVDYQVVIRDKAAADAVPRTPAVGASTKIGPHGYEWVGFFEEQVIALVQFKKDVTGKRVPLVEKDGEMIELGAFRSAADNHNEHWGGESITVTVAQTGDGKDVFLWDEHGFERDGTGFFQTFSLARGQMHDQQRFTVPAEPAGFYYLVGRGLHESQRGCDPILHLPKLTNIMAVRPGPEGSLLLMEGTNKAGDWGKLYWPKEKRLVRIKPSLLPDLSSDDLREMHWLESQQRLLFFTREEVWFIPWEELKAIPRTKA